MAAVPPSAMALQDDAIAPAQADQLQSADPADWPVAPDWQPLVKDFFAGATGQQLLTFLHQRLEAGAVARYLSGRHVRG